VATVLCSGWHSPKGGGVCSRFGRVLRRTRQPIHFRPVSGGRAPMSCIAVSTRRASRPGPWQLPTTNCRGPDQDAEKRDALSVKEISRRLQQKKKKAPHVRQNGGLFPYWGHVIYSYRWIQHEVINKSRCNLTKTGVTDGSIEWTSMETGFGFFRSIPEADETPGLQCHDRLKPLTLSSVTLRMRI